MSPPWSCDRVSQLVMNRGQFDFFFAGFARSHESIAASCLSILQAGYAACHRSLSSPKIPSQPCTVHRIVGRRSGGDAALGVAALSSVLVFSSLVFSSLLFSGRRSCRRSTVTGVDALPSTAALLPLHFACRIDASARDFAPLELCKSHSGKWIPKSSTTNQPTSSIAAASPACRPCLSTVARVPNWIEPVSVIVPAHDQNDIRHPTTWTGGMPSRSAMRSTFGLSGRVQSIFTQSPAISRPVCPTKNAPPAARSPGRSCANGTAVLLTLWGLPGPCPQNTKHFLPRQPTGRGTDRKSTSSRLEGVPRGFSVLTDKEPGVRLPAAFRNAKRDGLLRDSARSGNRANRNGVPPRPIEFLLVGTGLTPVGVSVWEFTPAIKALEGRLGHGDGGRFVPALSALGG